MPLLDGTPVLMCLSCHRVDTATTWESRSAAGLDRGSAEDQEWERPSVFLHGHIADNVDLGDLTIDRIDIDWTEDDYRALCLVCPEADLTGQFVPREVRDRMPGPHDVPLPIEEK